MSFFVENNTMNASRIGLYIGHIAFWSLNYWFVIFGSAFNWNGFSYSDGSLAYAYAYGLFFNALLFYAQAFLFLSIYKRNQKIRFYLVNLIIIVLVTVIETYLDFWVYDLYHITDELISGSLTTNFIIHVLYSAAGFYYIIKFEYRKSEKVKQKLIEETYKSELKYLKAQLNPHFLFNGINSVYHLIGKDDTLAKETLLQFSGLLRYQLYESNAHIPLEKELDYIQKYIKIEETRKGGDINLIYDIQFENAELKIAPLLLIPFIENAFKHCSNHIDSNRNTIDIQIKEQEKQLSMKVINSYDDISIVKNGVGGIGLQNVQKRLSLVYPDQHQLSIQKENAQHMVNLSIRL